MVAEKVEEKGEKLRNIRMDSVEFDSASKVRETEEAVIVPAIIARESVSVFCSGRGYKPASELKAAAFTLDGAWVTVFSHAPRAYIQNRQVIRGSVHDVAFDGKINAVRGDIWFRKDLCDEALLEKVRKGDLSKDLSASYWSDDIYEPGTFGSDNYDFVQRNLMFGHVAVGVVEGRCPSPFCGLQMDSAEGFLMVNVRDPALFTCRLATLTVDAERGIFAAVGKLKDSITVTGYSSGAALVRDYLFDSVKGWTPETAQEWIRENADQAEGNGKEEQQQDFVGFDLAKLDPAEELLRSRRLVQYFKKLR